MRLTINLYFRTYALCAIAMAALAADKVVPAEQGILWREPSDIASRDLLYGSGGKNHAPNANGKFTFEKEELDGTNPKFVVRDSDGAKWKVKLGTEARPETAASRFIWAVGYSTNEDYCLPKLIVQGLPDHLRRGQNLKQPDGSFLYVRMKRDLKHEAKAGQWKWRDNAFSGTRELDGLRVMMALINNWDLKDENNAIYDTESGKIFLVKDLGASFGTTGESWTLKRSKGNIAQYEKSKFITRSTPGYICFGTPSLPVPIFIYDPVGFFQRVHMEELGRNIPREDVKWIARELAKLSPEQVRDAFRAAGYSRDDVERFAEIVQRRIAALQGL